MSARCSRIRDDSGRHTIQIAPIPAAASTSADTTVSTRRGIHQGCGSFPVSTRRTTTRRRISNRSLDHTASPPTCMRLRYPAREDVKPEVAEGAPQHCPECAPCVRLHSHAYSRTHRPSASTVFSGAVLKHSRIPGAASLRTLTSRSNRRVFSGIIRTPPPIIAKPNVCS